MREPISSTVEGSGGVENEAGVEERPGFSREEIIGVFASGLPGLEAIMHGVEKGIGVENLGKAGAWRLKGGREIGCVMGEGGYYRSREKGFFLKKWVRQWFVCLWRKMTRGEKSNMAKRGDDPKGPGENGIKGAHGVGR